MEYNKGGIDLSTTTSMGRVQREKAPSRLSGGPEVQLVDKTENIEELVDKIDDLRKTSTTDGMSTTTTDGMNAMHVENMKCTFSKDDTCVIHNVKGTVLHVTTKKWKKNVKTGLFGNVSTRSRKLLCKARNITPVVSKISTDVQSQRLEINDSDILGAGGTGLQTDGLPDNLQSDQKVQKVKVGADGDVK